MKKLLMISVLLGWQLAASTVFAVDACERGKMYFEAGYSQHLLYTKENRLTAAPTSDKITFGPGPGGHAMLGYNVCNTRWGIQMPVEYTNARLNSAERVHLFGASVEGVFRVKNWEEGADFHLTFGVGGNYLTEGSIADQTSSVGVSVGVGPGLTWYISKGRPAVGIMLDLPIRAIYFLGNRLSVSNTLVFSVPVRLGVSFAF